jgi:hypothetical protein
MLLCFTCLLGYQRAVYDDSYFGKNLSKRFYWHNIGIGLSLNPEIARNYNLNLSDRSIADLVYQTLLKRNDFSNIKLIFGNSISQNGTINVGELINNQNNDLIAYESEAKNVVFSIILDNPGEAILTYIWYKPKMAVLQFLWVTGHVPDDLDRLMVADQIGSIATPEERKRDGIFLNLTRLEVGALLLMLCYFAIKLPLRDLAIDTLRLYPIAFLSFIPPLLSYPIIHVLGTFFVSIVFLIYSTVLLALCFFIKSIFKNIALSSKF